MTKKEKVLGLFDFLMDLLDESDETTTQPKEVLTDSDTPDKVLQNPLQPHHPLLNPYVSFNMENKPKWANGSLDLMNKMSTIDKEHAVELGKTRAVKKAVSPLITELEELKKSGIGNAIKDRDEEILKNTIGDVGDKLGVTVENGKVKLVDVPNKLRDNIPLDDNVIYSGGPIGVSVKKTDMGNTGNNPNEIQSLNSLPKGVKEQFVEASKVVSKAIPPHNDEQPDY